MEKPMKVNIHSFSDAITNSSTSIYIKVRRKGVEAMKDLINYFLKQGGSEKTAEDLYDFKIISDSYDENDNLIYKEVEPYDEDSNEESYGNNYLIMIPKDNSSETIDLTEKFQQIFESVEEYDY